MSFTKKATYLKQEFEYNSKDGEIYTVTVVESYGKMYVQWTNPSNKATEKDVVVVDAEMIMGLYAILNDVTGNNRGEKTNINFKKPKVTDHRNDNYATIDKEIAKTMQNFNNDNKPVESFAVPKQKDESVWDNEVQKEVIRSGVDISAAIAEVEETPDDLKKELESISDDVKKRMNKKNTPQIDASDLL